jgi:predicted transcriptional regulator
LTKGERVSYRTDAETLLALEELAAKKRRSKSWIVDEIVRKYLSGIRKKDSSKCECEATPQQC